MKRLIPMLIAGMTLSILLDSCSSDATTPPVVVSNIKDVIDSLEKELNVDENESNDTSIVFNCFRDKLDEHAKKFYAWGARRGNELYQIMFSESELINLLFVTQGKYLMDIGWEFSPGEGYFYLPKYTVKDSAAARFIIERMEVMNGVLNIIEKRLVDYLRQYGIEFPILWRETHDYEMMLKNT